MADFNPTISKIILNTNNVTIPIKRQGFLQWIKARLTLCSL